MASGNYNDSVLLAAVGIMDKKFNEKELRKPEYGALDSFLTKRKLLIPNLESIWKAENQPVSAKFLERDAQTIGAARTCTPTAQYGDSGDYPICFETYSHTVQTDIKVFEYNDYSRVEAFQNDIYNRFMDMYAQIEQDALDYLYANRTTVQGLRTLNTWNAAAAIMEVAAADRDNYLNYIQVEMIAQRYRRLLLDVHQVNMLAMYRQQFAQGQCNDENLKFQFPNYNHFMTLATCAPLGSDYYGGNFIIEEGGIAVLDWIPQLNRKGQKSENGHIWTTMKDPFGYPFTWAVHIIDSCVDTSFVGSGGTLYGATQDYRRIYEFSLDLSFNDAPITVAGETPIHMYALMAS